MADVTLEVLVAQMERLLHAFAEMRGELAGRDDKQIIPLTMNET
jgi:hypothetical protein